MSKWKGPFKELHEKALKAGAKDIVKGAESLREAFIAEATGSNMNVKDAEEIFDGLVKRLKERKSDIVERKPFDRGMLHKL